jgi:benzoyl-CoA reductase subunit A
MNDKCAAGTGRGMEVFADLLGVSVEDIGDLSLDVDEEPELVSSSCVVFAKSEATGLLRSGWSRQRVLASYCSAMASRVASLLARIGVEPELAITGGIAKNRGVTVRLARTLGIRIRETGYDTQIAGALGAALFGQAIVLRKRAGAER